MSGHVLMIVGGGAAPIVKGLKVKADRARYCIFTPPYGEFLVITSYPFGGINIRDKDLYP